MGSQGAPEGAHAHLLWPKGIKLDVIAQMNRDFVKASLMGAEEAQGGSGTG